MKKLNSTTYKYAASVTQYGQYKAVETNDGFLLNTVYHHNKETFEPTTKQSFNDVSDLTWFPNVLALNTHTSYNNMIPSINENIVVDLYNPNIYYVYTDFSIEKFYEKDGEFISDGKIYSTPYNYTVTTYSSSNFLKYLGQSQEYLYFASGESQYYTEIKSILKSTLVKTTLASYNGLSHSLKYYPMTIKETDNYIYCLYHTTTTNSSTSYLYAHIGTIDKINNTCNFVNTSSGCIKNWGNFSPYNINLFSDATIKISDTMYGILLRYEYKGTNSSAQYIAMVTLDITDETTPVSTYTLLPITDFVVPATYNETTYQTKYQTFLTTIGDNEYLHYIRYYSYPSATETNITRYFCMQTFKITRDENNVPSGLTQVYLSQNNEFIKQNVINHLTTQDNKVLIFFTYQNIYVFRINEETGIFELVQTKYMTNPFLSAGIDKLNRIWVMDNQYAIEIISLTDFTTYSLEFEKESYAYTGEDISTYVKVKCLDFVNTYIDATVNLTISGNAVFTDNNTKVLTVEIHNTDTEDLTVPITITGAGRVIIYPTLVTE